MSDKNRDKLTQTPDQQEEEAFERSAGIDVDHDEHHSMIVDDGVGSSSGGPLLRSGDTSEATHKQTR
ncbi:MAG: hypothetical protein R3C52_09600 [Hyphomonadaceae bacterium]